MILFIIITGSIKSDPNNWKIDSTTIPVENNAGEGGFFPYGFEGTLQGAAISFFAYVGIDFILVSGEKVANPKKSIPKAIIFSIFAICIIYVCISTVLTLMLPYYLHVSTLKLFLIKKKYLNFFPGHKHTISQRFCDLRLGVR